MIKNKFLFTTNSNKNLAKRIVAKTGLVLGKARVDRFVDHEVAVFIKEDVRKKEVYVLGATFPPAENLLELLILIHTLKVNGAKKVTAIIPYFGYAKADHVKSYGDPVSAQLIIRAIEQAGADKINVIHIHSKMALDFFKAPVKNVTAVELLSKHIKKLKLKNLAIVSPDAGGIKDARHCASVLGLKDVVIINKMRPQTDKAKVLDVIGEVEGKNLLIVDDMVQTGGTLIKAVEALKKMGAKDIYIALAHLVYTAGSVPKLARNKNIKKIFVTDSIPVPKNKKLPAKFAVVPVDDLIIKML